MHPLQLEVNLNTPWQSRGCCTSWSLEGVCHFRSQERRTLDCCVQLQLWPRFIFLCGSQQPQTSFFFSFFLQLITQVGVLKGSESILKEDCKWQELVCVFCGLLVLVCSSRWGGSGSLLLVCKKGSSCPHPHVKGSCPGLHPPSLLLTLLTWV